MRKYFLIFSLMLVGSFLTMQALALPAPSTLNEREKRLNAPTPTPTPRPQILQTPQAPPTRSAIPSQQTPQTRTATAPTTTTMPTTKAVSPEGPRPSTVVVIDPGHGGHDRGGIAGQRVPESMMNLDVAQRLKALLQAQGYRVVMTRDSDVFIPLGTRVAIANSYRDAIFVCIHFNATPRRAASGIETYFYSSQSLPLASAIHYYVAGGAPSANRGVRRRGFYVLRNTRIPSVLVECGFLTNPTEAQYAQSTVYRQKLAEEIGRGVRERSLVAGGSSGNRLAANSAGVPLQPFIDQTHYRDPDLVRSKHKRSSKSSKSSKSKKSSGSDSDSDTPKKSKKKKSTPAKTED
jgi:N-acetylmuramoyl-L-alanine amidase